MTYSSLANRAILTPRTAANGTITRVVLHRMEAPLKAGTAAAVARYFASGAGGRGVVAHYCIDPSEIVACLHDEQLGVHAPPNGGSVGIEQAGYCANDDWNTPPGQQMLDRTVALTRDLCRRHNLPLVWLTATDLKAGRRGVTSHHQVSVAFGQSSHTDPDPHFPLDLFMRRLTSGTTPPPPPIQEDPFMALSDAQQADIHDASQASRPAIVSGLKGLWLVTVSDHPSRWHIPSPDAAHALQLLGARTVTMSEAELSALPVADGS